MTDESLDRKSGDEARERLVDVPGLRAAALGGLLLLAGLASTLADPEWIEPVLHVAALVVAGRVFVPGSIRALLAGRLGVDLLMTIAAAGAVALGDLGEAALLAVLFAISEGLESWAERFTRHGLRSVLDLVPARVLVRREEADVEVDAAEIQVGTVLVVRPGERIATDGVVVAGRSTLDLSVVTGESIPVESSIGDAVYAGTLNGGGVLEMEATAGPSDNTLARMVRLVEEAHETKGATQRVADRIARRLVPGILVVALLVAVVGSLLGDPAVWLRRALVVLVAAAPCAFALSVPVAAVSAIGAATKRGVLIKGGAVLEFLARAHIVAFDKTGTLTEGRPRVTEIVAIDGADSSRVLWVASSLEARSEHPLAGAIRTAEPTAPSADDVEAIPGKGIIGVVDGVDARLGSPAYIDSGPLSSDVERLETAGATVIVVEVAAKPIGLIAVRDDLRPEAGEAVSELRQSGISRIVMLSGDHQGTAQAIAEQAGITEVRAQLLPEDKVKAITDLGQTGAVMMVGDGVNDAPALAAAEVGIAMGAAGTAAAMEAADIALMGDDLRTIPQVVAHARRAVRVLRQNLAISGGIILALIPLAATGILGLAAVVAAHEIAEVLVIANGLRARRFQTEVVGH